MHPSTRVQPHKPARLAATFAALLVATLTGCHGKDSAPKAPFELTTTALFHGLLYPDFTCDGANVSPQLNWGEPPAGTASFAIIAIDPQAPSGHFVHWVLYNLPADTRLLPGNVAKDAQLPDGSRQGRNDFGNIGYGGPCPPIGITHHYHFTLYALNTALNLPPGAARSQLQTAMQTHILDQSEFVAAYGR